MTRPLRVLVVEDDPLAIDLFWRDLPGKRIKVVTATNGADALELLHSEAFDLLVTDLVMPVMNGLQLITAVRAAPRLSFIPILVATGYVAGPTRIASFKAGADECITKPFSRSDIVRLLEFLLVRRRQQVGTWHA